jgi:hypothetical protein
MLQLKPNYVTDSANKKIAVQLNLKTYQKIEEVLENYSLFHLMEEDEDEVMDEKSAKEYYKTLKKKK